MDNQYFKDDLRKFRKGLGELTETVTGFGKFLAENPDTVAEVGGKAATYMLPGSSTAEFVGAAPEIMGEGQAPGVVDLIREGKYTEAGALAGYLGLDYAQLSGLLAVPATGIKGLRAVGKAGDELFAAYEATRGLNIESGGPPIGGGGDDGQGDLFDSVRLAREQRKEAARERSRIKPEAIRRVDEIEKDAVFDDYGDFNDYSRERVASFGVVSKVRQELESIGMGKNPWSAQKIRKELNKRGVSDDQLEASGLTPLLERQLNITKEELVAQHEKFAPQLEVVARQSRIAEYAKEQRLSDAAEAWMQEGDEIGLEPGDLSLYNAEEVTIRNTNPLTADFKTKDDHFDESGNLGHARTSQTRLAGIGRAEVIEEVQSDLFKAVRDNQRVAKPGDILKAARSASNAANRLYEESLPSIERAEDLYQEALPYLSDAPKLQERLLDDLQQLRRASRELKAQNSAFSRRLDHEAKGTAEQAEGTLSDAVDELSFGRFALTNQMERMNNRLFDTVGVIDRAGQNDLASRMIDHIEQENFSDQGRLRLVRDDAVRLLANTQELFNRKINPIAQPRAIEEAQKPEVKQQYQAIRDAGKKRADLQAENSRQSKELSRLQQERDQMIQDLNRQEAFLMKPEPSPQEASNMEINYIRSLKEGMPEKIEAKKQQIAEFNDVVTEQQALVDDTDRELRAAQAAESNTRDAVEAKMDPTMFSLIDAQERGRSLNVSPAMPFSTLKDTSEFIYDTMLERAANNPSINAVVIPDYRDIAVTRRGVDPENFKIGYLDAPNAAIKSLKERYPGVTTEKRRLPGTKYESTVVVFPRKPEEVTSRELTAPVKPLVHKYAEGGLVSKGIGSMSREVL